MEWWLWVLIGLVLLLAEVLTPGGFFLFFFGCAAGLVGALVALGALPEFWQQGAVASVASVVAIALFRQPLKERFTPPSPGVPVDSMIGEVAIASGDIAPGGTGKVEMRGTAWNARNIGPAPLASGQRCRVELVDGLTLLIRAE